VGPERLLCDDPAAGAIGWGSYPMAPWAGRLRDGRFGFGGAVHQLALNHVDADGARHAIHGTVFDAEWTVDEVGPDATTLHCPLDVALGWPFAGTARQTITVGGDGVTCRLSVDTDGEPFPASIGWHPWFRKPDRIEFNPTRFYPRDAEGIAVRPVDEPPPGPWDDCFVNEEPVLIERAGQRLRLVSSCRHWVVYDETAHATCIEPQSGPPDAFSLEPTRLAPGSSIAASFTLEWS